MSVPTPEIQRMHDSLSALCETVSWFRSNADLRRLCAVSSMDEQKLRLLDRFVHEGLGNEAGEFADDDIRALVDAALSLERTVNSEILPLISRRLTQRGPAPNDESVTRLRMTRDLIEPNSKRLVEQVCDLRAASLSVSRVA